MAGFDNVLAGSRCQVADDGCFKVNLAFHNFSLGSGKCGLSPIPYSALFRFYSAPFPLHGSTS